MNDKVDFSYTLSDEKLLAYSARPLLDRLKWLDEVRQFILMVRAAPTLTEEGQRRRDGKATDAT